MLFLRGKASEWGFSSKLVICYPRKEKKIVLYYFRPTAWQEFKPESRVSETGSLGMLAGFRAGNEGEIQ